MRTLHRAATISSCGRYRYDLVRGEGEPSICWLMLNPSTADAHTDDPTIRRVVGFSQRWGFGTVVVVNLFAYRATQPTALLSVDDPVGPDNDATIRETVTACTVTVLAHGVVHRRLHDRARTVELLLLAAGVPLVCLGQTADGSPRHPLYVRGDTQPVPA